MNVQIVDIVQPLTHGEKVVFFKKHCAKPLICLFNIETNDQLQLTGIGVIDNECFTMYV